MGNTTQEFPETGATRATGAAGIPAEDLPGEDGSDDPESSDGRAEMPSSNEMPSRKGADRDFPGAPRAGRGQDVPEPAGRRAVVRDPWDESGSGAGHLHDPHEVTVQLDAVSVNGDDRIEGRPGGDGGSEGSDGPVFVDESGRRSRRFRRIGIAVGLACAVYAIVIAATLLSGNSNAPWLPVTGPKDDAPADKVDTSPVPTESADHPAASGVIPGTTPTVSGGATPAPGTSGTAPGVTASPGKPGASADPSATATQPGGNPSVSIAPPSQPSQSVTPPPSASVSPPVTSSPDSSVAPTGSAGAGSAGPGPVADGPASPSPIASETPGTGGSAPALPSDAPLSPSPEHIL